jgi:hypothetical protein
LSYYSGMWVEGLRKAARTSVPVAGVLADIWTEHLLNVLLWYCRPVLTDLARILTLLNRPEHLLISPPSDWEKLLAWGERVLRRYKKQNPHQVCRICVTSLKITRTLSTHLLFHYCIFPVTYITYNLNSVTILIILTKRKSRTWIYDLSPCCVWHVFFLFTVVCTNFLKKIPS